MSDTVVRVEGLGKRYRIGRRQRYSTLRDSIVEAASAPVRWLRRRRTTEGECGAAESIWALRDVSFQVKRGEVVGVIGRNGAGKSTLLKVLSRITEPTAGEAEIRGRVGSLLEVGTGFHPELTGRENVFLNGAVLGMRRAEIARKFDAIVDFAEVEQFLDTPVKHYSSGMYMRLAFAVAAHLEPEILIVDEVLAVGDSAFQKKCLGKLAQLGAQHRTVLFVSHNMPLIQRLCSRALLLDKGQLIADDTSHAVLKKYMANGAYSLAERVWDDPIAAPGDDVARLHSVRVLTEGGAPAESFDVRWPVSVEVTYWQLREDARPAVSLQFFNENGLCLFSSNDFSNRGWWESPRRRGQVRAVCLVPGNFLAEGQVFVLAALCSYTPGKIHVAVPDAVSFYVVDRSDGDGVRGPYVGPWPGVVRPWLDWAIRPAGPAGVDGPADPTAGAVSGDN